MAEHIGIVIKTESNNYAQVVTDRKGACGGCQSSPGGCRSCLTGAKMESRAANPIGVKPADLVKVHLSSANLFTGAAILYRNHLRLGHNAYADFKSYVRAGV
jgi:sigma-E factor negative regulatory protein RseC